MSGENGKRAHWRSLDELADTPEFRELVSAEFPGLEEDIADPATRREFVKILGASLGMVGLTSCRWPKEMILPFASQPAGRAPGVAVQYATAMELCGATVGLLVTSYDGRPVKIEGNPLHPASLGAASAPAQAAVLELYDPARSRQPVRREGGKEARQSWEDFDAFATPHFNGLRASRGRGLAILSEASSSPTLARLRVGLVEALPEARWYGWEPLSRDNELEGARLAFGRSVRGVPDLSRARVIVSLDGDLLAGHPDALRLAREFAATRRGDGGEMNRLFAAEPVPSVTGAAADHRLALAAGSIPALASSIAAGLAAHGVAVPEALRKPARALDARAERFAAAAAADLAVARGRSLIVAGPRQPAEVHALAWILNEALGAFGATLRAVDDPDGDRESHVQSVTGLAGRLRAGEVETLLILGGNAAYDAPADLGLADLIGRARVSIHLSLHDNETSRRCAWHVPRAHFLESWGDARAWDGTVSVQQPLIEALYGGRTPLELVAALSGARVESARDLVRATPTDGSGSPLGEAGWRRALHDGVVEGSGLPPVRVSVRAEAAGPVAARLGVGAGRGTEAVFLADASVHDGRFANNAWLQELPDPITRVTWDNAALVGPATAAELGVRHGEMVALTAGERSIEIAACVVPGVAEGVIGLPLGYGRRAAGPVGDGVGFDVYPLRVSEAPHAVKVDVRGLGRSYVLASTQDHHAIDAIGMEERGRRIGELIVEAEWAEYRRDPDAIRRERHEPKPLALFGELEYGGDHQWGMTIDLSACIGCNACAVACQAENNIPVVGKKQVARGREMHWIRVDRYFKGSPEAPAVAFQPVACQHCENAPCESVCPVAATVHSSEGLNSMVYNRCVGTRYCSNNCPYKVRRFNYFNYFKRTSQVEKMAFNPDVTVRARGVMEKCTFCVQRIESVKIAAKNERRPIADGAIVPACAQTCPTEAIVFGDLRDPSSRVSQLHRHPRAYSLLAELNVQPRNRYLAKLRNPSSGAEEA
ncbi:MAG: TAT-variant-translocated molybdopterin oxidoreductase [Acidobacteriota bacterium]